MAALARYHGTGPTPGTNNGGNALSHQTITAAIPRQEVELPVHA